MNSTLCLHSNTSIVRDDTIEPEGLRHCGNDMMMRLTCRHQDCRRVTWSLGSWMGATSGLLFHSSCYTGGSPSWSAIEKGHPGLLAFSIFVEILIKKRKVLSEVVVAQSKAVLLFCSTRVRLYGLPVLSIYLPSLLSACYLPCTHYA